MQVGGTFEQDGKKYIAIAFTEANIMCQGCAFTGTGKDGCLRTPSCIADEDNGDEEVIYVEQT